MQNEDATIVTFYSYKGGVGRSMAVANVAWILANKFHKRVLVVDWDLEAPGLHRFLDIQDHEVTRGLIELLNDYKALLRQEQKALPEKLVDVRKYIQGAAGFLGGGTISLLAAGKQDSNYANQINQFSWDEFYAKWHGFGFIEYLKHELKKLPEIDVVIVDSRTGVTDIGGICTLQLPDIVVLLFALNDQNIRGVKLVAERISEKAVEIEGRDRPPALIIRPARVERTGNQEEKIKWQGIAARVLGEHVPEGEIPQIVMAKRNIPYIGDYSYGETPLAVEKDPLGDMAEAFEDLAETILRTAGQENRVTTSRSFLSRLNLTRHTQRFLRNGKNGVIVVLILFVAALVFFADRQRREISDLKNEVSQLSASRTSTPTPAPTMEKAAPTDWATTAPDQAWCYQKRPVNPRLPYVIRCHRSQDRCEIRRKTEGPTLSDCEFVQDLKSTPGVFQREVATDSWYKFSVKEFARPQLPAK